MVFQIVVEFTPCEVYRYGQRTHRKHSSVTHGGIIVSNFLGNKVSPAVSKGHQGLTWVFPLISLGNSTTWLKVGSTPLTKVAKFLNLAFFYFVLNQFGLALYGHRRKL